MYNGVGLQTARGSGTSGYIQKNLSHIGPGSKPKVFQQNYGKILQQMKENPTPLPRPANEQILKHEQMRHIEAQVYKLEKELKSSNSNNQKYTEEEISKIVQDKRHELMDQLETDGDRRSRKGKHGQGGDSQQQKLFAKQKHMEVFKQALKIDQEHKFGEAFDVELQEKKRLKKMADKQQRLKEEQQARKMRQAEMEKAKMLKEIEDMKRKAAAEVPEKDDLKSKASRSSRDSRSRSSRKSRSRSSSSSQKSIHEEVDNILAQKAAVDINMISQKEDPLKQTSSKQSNRSMSEPRQPEAAKRRPRHDSSEESQSQSLKGKEEQIPTQVIDVIHPSRRLKSPSRERSSQRLRPVRENPSDSSSSVVSDKAGTKRRRLRSSSYSPKDRRQSSSPVSSPRSRDKQPNRPDPEHSSKRRVRSRQSGSSQSRRSESKSGSRRLRSRSSSSRERTPPKYRNRQDRSRRSRSPVDRHRSHRDDYRRRHHSRSRSPPRSRRHDRRSRTPDRYRKRRSRSRSPERRHNQQRQRPSESRKYNSREHNNRDNRPREQEKRKQRSRSRSNSPKTRRRPSR